MNNDSRRYVAVILKEPDTHYLATVPDLGACFATGKTIDEAKAGLPDALALHIDGMIAGGLPLPPPRRRAAVLAAVDEPVVTDYVVEIEPDAPAEKPPSTSVSPTREM